MAVLWTALWMDRRLSLKAFEYSFHQRFPRGRIVGVIEYPAAAPNYRLVQLRTPRRQHVDLERFMEDFASQHQGILTECTGNR